MTEPDLEAALARLGFSAFRPGQREAIETLLRVGRLLLVAPTGGGKSLIYQLPASVLPGTTVVVSPLISLMHDQVAALESRGVPATYLASTLAPEELHRRESALARGRCKLVYVAPERLAHDSFRWLLGRIACPLVAVDEAHCISHWGHDFRPDYLQIGEILPLVPAARVLACTATATPIVRDEIIQRLGLPPETPQMVRGFARPNLVFRAVETRTALARSRHVDATLRECLGTQGAGRGTAIIYAPTRRSAGEETERLKIAGWRAAAYHAGMSGPEREAAQSAFMAGKLEIVAATNAFGMGIDRPDVRCVLHLAPPASIEAYYQEAGRAGRDGKTAVCLLMVSPGDLPLRRRLIERSGDGGTVDEETVRHKWNLFLELMRLVEGGCCRHDAILRYFGDEEETLHGCGHCDVCLELAERPSAAEEIDTVVRKALCGVARVDGRFGLTTAARLLRGESDERMQRTHLDRTPTFGTLAEYPEEWLVRLLRRCVTAGWVDFSGGDRPVVVVTREGMNVIHARRPARILLPALEGPDTTSKGARRKRGKRDALATPAGREKLSSRRDGRGARPGSRAPAESSVDGREELDPRGRGLFEALRGFRIEAARREKVPPYVIASDRTLRDIAVLRPASMDELMLAYGIGEARAARYGAEILEVVRRAR